MNWPPLTTNGAPCVGTAAAIVTVPAFSISIICAPERLPTATLPNFSDFGRTCSLPPAAGVGVGEAVMVAVAVAVAVIVALAVGEGVPVAVADAVAVGVGVASIAS